MRFLLRSLLVLAVAALFSLVLYYAVQALPGNSPAPRPGVNIQPQSGRTPAENSTPRPERSERNQGGLRWRLILDLARRVIVFSAMVFIAVLGKNYIFERKPKKQNTTD